MSNRNLEKLFLVFVLAIGLCACQSRPVSADARERDPAAVSNQAWVEFEYDHPEKSGILQEVLWREEELTTRAMLMNKCGLTRDFHQLEPIEQELLFVRLESWPHAKVSAAIPWLNEQALRCLLRPPEI